MDFHVSDILPAAGIVCVIYAISRLFRALLVTHRLNHIPSIGSSNPLLSYYYAYRFLLHSQEMVQEGYDKYYGSAFKVPTLLNWTVVVTGPQMLDDIRRADDDQVSFDVAALENLESDYTLGPEIRVDPYHIGVIKSSLTRHLAACFLDIKDEITAAFTELIPPTEEWTAVPALKTAMNIVCRTSNRMFVGLPLCRDPEYLALNEQFTIDVVVGALALRMFPPILRPLVGRFLTRLRSSIRRAIALAGPTIQAQIDLRKEDISLSESQNNLISWLIREAQGDPIRETVRDIAIRLLTTNFGSIHSTSGALTDILYDVATYPEYVGPMREEVETVIASEGWTKASMGKMLKVDSFIKESQRFGLGSLQISRKIMKDFTFSNGLSLPAGTSIGYATLSTHLDKRNYEDSRQFRGFRYAEKREEEGHNLKHQLVSLTPDFLTFGTGRHGCPGRFLAANELKAMLAYILMNYDVKLPKADQARPKEFRFAGVHSPNRSAEVMFRKRVQSKSLVISDI